MQDRTQTGVSHTLPLASKSCPSSRNENETTMVSRDLSTDNLLPGMVRLDCRSELCRYQVERTAAGKYKRAVTTADTLRDMLEKLLIGWRSKRAALYNLA